MNPSLVQAVDEAITAAVASGSRRIPPQKALEFNLIDVVEVLHQRMRDRHADVDLKSVPELDSKGLFAAELLRSPAVVGLTRESPVEERRLFLIAAFEALVVLEKADR